MDRSILGAIFGSLFGISALGGLAFIGASPNPMPGKPEGDWRLLDPVAYENITIFPVVSSSTQDTSPFLTLDEGLTSGAVIVSEQGAAGLARSRDGRPVAVPQHNSGASVNQLVLINRGKRPLLLLAGELVSGGKQDRIIGKDRIVPVGSDPLPLDVFCVEHGRWTGASSQFDASKTIVHPSVREQAAVGQNQNEVWSAVRSGTLAAPKARSAGVAGGVAAPPPPPAKLSSEAIGDAIATAAPTQSYRKIYEQSRAGSSVDEFVVELERRFNRATLGLKGERVVGVVVAYGGDVAWSDIFASGDLFEHYWSKLLRSYAVEAMARPAYRETAAITDAREFLRSLNGREVVESEPGVYRWREITEGRLSLIELEAIAPKPMTLHRLLLHRTS
jgi:ARG and Rhodanese-Phosphatase-superfamily-associated Protein domain